VDFDSNIGIWININEKKEKKEEFSLQLKRN
jgi:hypothetical protein